MLNRRRCLAMSGGMLATAAIATQSSAAATTTLPFPNGRRPLEKYPGKRPLIRLTARPPQLETPFAIFNQGALTPNDAFFVRYHLADLPTSIDGDAHRIVVQGAVDKPLSLSLDDLKTAFAPQEIVAVLQCSGNSRGFFDPRVGGGQLGNGAMGNARWKGVPLAAVLQKAGVKKTARQVTFDGLDGPVVDKTPDFVKALDVDHAMDGEVLIAYAMNGADLPYLNGYPVRLVVPGYFGTYWVKHLSAITLVDKTFDGFWMKTAYRIPDNECHCVPPGTKPSATVPIGRMPVRSFITNVRDGARVKRGKLALKGIAFDGSDGIAEVYVSTDGMRSWTKATLGPDLGKYSFREWRATVRLARGKHDLAVRAVTRAGRTQPETAQWNPAGYMRNVIETVRVKAT